MRYIIKILKLWPKYPQIFKEKIWIKVLSLWQKRELLPFYLIPVRTAENELVILTCCDSSHYASQCQFLTSLYVHEPNIKCVFYDLGLSDTEILELTSKFPKLIYKKFDYSVVPDYFDLKINGGAYAWKPILIYNEFNNLRTDVLYFDAGNVITEPLKTIRKIIFFKGFYSPQSVGTLKEWSHPDTLWRMNVSKRECNRKNLNGAAAGFRFNSMRASMLVSLWRNAALDKGCISPDGASRMNHRFDQTLLTILAGKLKLRFLLPKRYYGFDVHKDID